jgi:small-conductance mechanosensitive channel
MPHHIEPRLEAGMSFKEWESVVNIIAALVIGAWVIFEALTNPPASIAVVASRLLWAILFGVLFTIAAMIAMSILVSIARREQFRDEKADERDRLVSLRAMRNGYVIASIAGIACLFTLAFGTNPAEAAYVLFGGLLLAGLVDAASRLVYYRIG